MAEGIIPGAILNSTAAAAAFGRKEGKTMRPRAKKKRATTKKRPVRKTRRKTAAKKRARVAPKGRLKKGSPAAKRRMAQLRAMQKRR